jgi:hypothetical protein
MGRSERPVTLTVWTDGRIDPSARIEIPRLDGAPEREFESAYEMKNVQGRFFKFRVELSGPAEIYGLQLAFTSMREWDDG